MAVITQTNNVKSAVTATAVTRTALSASDTLTFVRGSGQVLFLWNTTGSPVNVTITGSTATTISPPGFGGTVDVSAGKVVTVGANASVYLDLDDIYEFLKGTITVTGGTGVTAHLFT